MNPLDTLRLTTDGIEGVMDDDDVGREWVEQLRAVGSAFSHASQFTFHWPGDHTQMGVIVERRGGWTGGAMYAGEYDPEADRWAVIRLSRCLNRDGEWEWEPSPSNRDDEFIDRTRFALGEALEVAAKARDEFARDGRLVP